MAKRTNAAFRSLAKHPDSTHNSRIGSSLGGWSATLTQSGYVRVVVTRTRYVSGRQKM